MANHISHAALPFPVKHARYTVLVPYLDADGDPTDPTTPDTERSIDAAAFADCAEEVTTISGANGSGYLTLTGAEMDCSLLALAAKVASGPKATLLEVRPRVLPILATGTAQAGASGTITLASGASSADDFYNGCIVRTTGGTGGGGTGGANNQARVIVDYNGSTKVATIEPNWETTPSSDTTYDILLTDMAVNAVQAGAATVVGTVTADVTKWNGTTVATPDTAGYPKVTIKSGTGAGEVSLSSGTVTAGALSNNAITAAAIATDAIDADALAASAVTEMQSGLAAAADLATVAGYLDTEIAAIKAKTDNLPASPAATSDIPSPAAVADAVWDEDLSDHLATGSTGEALDNAGAAGTPPSVSDIVDGVLDELLAAHTDPGSVGEALGAAGATPADIADKILGRNIAGGADGGRTVTSALRRIRNRNALSGGTLTVYEEDDSTPDHTAAVTTAAGDPVVEVDPA